MATRATLLLDAQNIAYRVHMFAHDPRTEQHGAQAAAALDVSPTRVFKTLVIEVEGMHALALVPVSRQLSLKAFARVLGGKRAVLADTDVAERKTGYVVGGISPFAVRNRLPSVIDDSVSEYESVYVSAGQRGQDIELAPADLVRVINATCAPISR